LYKTYTMRLYYCTLLSLLILSISLYAQEDITYQQPSEPILSLANYEPAPAVSMDTKKNYMLLSYRSAYKSLADLNNEEMRLGGLRINPVTNISSTITYYNNLKIRKVMDVKAEPTQVAGLPENPRIANISWSPDDSKIAFTNTTLTGVELWVIDVATAQAKKLTEANLNCQSRLTI